MESDRKKRELFTVNASVSGSSGVRFVFLHDCSFNICSEDSKSAG